MDVLSRLWIEYTSSQDLIDIFITDHPLPYKSIGEGSNLLFSNDFKGTLLYNNITDIDIPTSTEDDVTIRVGGGIKMDDLVKITIEHGLWGLENLSGIPGTVGAAAVQNIGAYGVELCDIVKEVEVFDTHDATFKIFSKDECDYAYRKSKFKTTDKDRYVVTYVKFLLSRIPRPHLDYAHLKSVVTNHDNQNEIRRAIINMRDSKLPDPRNYGNAGSFFMNPVVDRKKYDRICCMYPDGNVPKYDVSGGVKIPAAWLIDKAGWRGRKMGSAAVWDKQPLVLIKWDASGNSQDIINLKDAIIKDINIKFEINLTPEVEIL